MGNSSSAAPSIQLPCSWGCELDHEQEHQSNINARRTTAADGTGIGTGRSIVAGTKLKGRLIVQVTEAIPPTLLKLNLFGHEHTSIEDRDSPKWPFRGTRLICSGNTILRQAGRDPIQSATYVFPFEMKLPDALPSSMHHRDRDRDGAVTSSISENWKIEYRLSVDATQDGTTETNVVSRPLTIRAKPLPNEDIPAVIYPKAHKVQTAKFGINRGIISIAARIVDAHVGRGTDLTIFMAVSNKATASIYRVQVELVEKMAWKAGKHEKSELSQTVARIEDVDLPSIGRAKQNKNVVRSQSHVGNDVQQAGQLLLLDELYDSLFSDECAFQFQVPKSCRDTYSGFLVKISHFIRITTFTRAHISNPSVEIPLKVGDPPPAIVNPVRPRRQRRGSSGEATEAVPPRRSTTTGEPHLHNQVDRPTSNYGPSSSQSTGPQDFSLNDQFSGNIMEDESNNDWYPLVETEIIAVAITNPDSSITVAHDAQLWNNAGCGGGIPMAEAFIISLDSAVEAPMASAPLETLHLGGIPPTYYSDETFVPLAPSFIARLPVSNEAVLSDLLDEMTYALNDYDILSRKLEDASWSGLLSRLSPEEYGDILMHVHVDMDQPRVAELLARHMGMRFTCAHASEGIRRAVDYNRTTVLERVIRFCEDIESNYGRIQDDLTEWEFAITRSAFHSVLRTRRP